MHTRIDAYLEKALLGLIALMITILGWIGSSITGAIKDLNLNVGELNASMKVIVNEVDHTKAELKEHDDRLKSLERK